MRADPCERMDSAGSVVVLSASDGAYIAHKRREPSPMSANAARKAPPLSDVVETRVRAAVG